MRLPILVFFQLMFTTAVISDAGASWVNQMGNGDSNSIYLAAGAAPGASVACAAGWVNTGSSPQVLFARTDNGDNWTEGGFNGYAGALAMVDNSIGFMGGILGKVWKTTDGGVSWVEIPEATLGGGTLTDSEFIADIVVSQNGQTVLIVGLSGLIAISLDQGSTWDKEEVSVPSGGSLTAGAVIGENIWFVGGTPSEEPTEGDDWEDPTPGHAGGDGFVLYSDDGGSSFDTIASNLEYELTDVSFVNPLEGWASASTSTEGGAAVGKTSDGGETWDFVSVPDFPEGEVFGVAMGASLVPAGCSGVEFFGREVGVAVCTSATFEADGATGLFLSTDGGASWEIQPGYKDAFASQMASMATIFDMAMIDCHRGWLVGGGKVIQRWDNDDQSLDCSQGGAPTEDVPDDLADPDASDGRGDDCGCALVGATSLNSFILAIVSALF